jgi:hypothetical protein
VDRATFLRDFADPLVELRLTLQTSLGDKVASLREDAWMFGEEVEVVDDPAQ